MDTHNYCDTCVVTQRSHDVMRRLWHRDTYQLSRLPIHWSRYLILIAIRITIRIAILCRDTIRVSPAQVS